MNFVQIFLMGGIVILVTMTLLWVLSLLIKDASIVDIFWGTGFVIVAWAYSVFTSETSARQWLILALVTIWGLRLTLHLAKRNLGKGEDYRYQKWRNEEGKRWWWLSYIRVFLLQGLIMWIVSLPLLGAQFMTSDLNILDYVAVLVWLIGFIFEAGGDWQLSQFRSNPANKGAVLQSGLWHYTRHPNYFGDAVQWWAFYLIALSAGAWWTIISPVIMTFFLMRVSGVTLLEKSLKKRKPEYQAYIDKTSAFFPMPPKSN
ncbi:MAG: DUF1295 domain-containing protein [Phototrophicaceae bacterium]